MDHQLQSQCFLQLRSLLLQQTDHISSYIDFLQLIRNTIAQNQSEALSQLLLENSSKMEAIEKLQIQQAELIRKFGFHTSEHGLQDMIDQCDKQDKLAQLKQDLTEKLEHLQKALLVNDLLIRKNQDRVRQSIRILSGHQANSATNTYSPQGMSASHQDKRSLAQA